MTSADLLREARLRAGLTQAELAARVGTTQSAIARWEAGATRPSLESLRRLVRACGLELRLAIEDHDPGDASLIEGTLALTPAERLDQLVRTVAFIREGRAAMAGRRG
ncbi:MAG TPA: helix-turn-helix transcriptional regulator [Gemmatimonadota bacterium]|jgi:transcriptional regulator with XRE-family HTH domain|nr:helix-turn-helix transcriptional regulator [Gemmatimonadota bacterium]